MADKKKRPPDEDEAQSKRFIEAARALESNGGLGPDEAERAFEDLASKVTPPRQSLTAPEDG